MDTYYESYFLNRSAETTVDPNSQKVIPNLPLTATSAIALTLRGVVGTLESGGQTGIGGASITVYAPDGTAVAQTTSESAEPETGAFTINFTGAQNVYYTVTAAAEGYTASSNTVTFSGTTFTTVILLLPVAAAPGIFYGTIVDGNTGAGIGGVNVNITDANVNVNVTTAADGSYLAYDSFVAGTAYTLTASKLGYTEQSTQAVLQQGAAGTRVDFTLTANAANYTSILGKVVIAGSDANAPIANALVGLYVVREGDIPADQLVDTVFTDYYGNYTFTNVNANNTYVVRSVKIGSAVKS